MAEGFFKYEEALLNRLIFETFGDQRYTQDSPIMPEVWISFARAPRAKLDMLLTPEAGDPPGKLAKQLGERLGHFRIAGQAAEVQSSFNIAYGRSSVVAELSFQQLICVVVPMTVWWSKLGQAKDYQSLWNKLEPLAKGKKTISAIIVDASDVLKRAAWDFLRFCALVGWIAIAADDEEEVTKIADPTEKAKQRKAFEERLTTLMAALSDGKTPVAEVMDVIKAYGTIAASIAEVEAEAAADEEDRPRRIFMITENREAHLAIMDSRCTVKADAAISLFNIDTSDFAWAVIDGGIDAQHPAFLNRRALDDYFKSADQRSDPRRATRDGEAQNVTQSSGEKGLGGPTASGETIPKDIWRDGISDSQKTLLTKYSRVRETYDFTYLRRLLATKTLPPESEGGPPEPLASFIRDKYGRQLDHLKTRTELGREIDWGIVAPLIRIPHDGNYYKPGSDTAPMLLASLGVIGVPSTMTRIAI